MKKLKVIIFTLASFPIFGQSYLGTNQKPAPDESSKTVAYNWKTLTQDNFSVGYPTNWELNTSGEDGTSLILLSPITSKGETFRANINLVIQDLENYDLEKNDINSQTITLKKVTESTLTKIKNYIKPRGGKIISSDLVNVGGISLQKVIYNFVGKDGLKLKSEEYILLQNNKTNYRLTFTCQEHKFTDYQATAEKILDSFKML
ncbi:MAG: Uncharacterised protein [Flavobacterium sp. SCGC AAA160-P02]|nr:MAG: Uncharacterised protein [Flavobacterium sp. SCGC AAA160-P02]